MFKVSTFCLAILALITFNAEAQRAIGRGQSPLTGRGGGSPLGPSNNGGGSITTTNSPSAGYVLTTDGTIYYWGVNTALLTNLPSYALTNFHSVDVVFNAGLAINGASTNNQIAYFNDDISQPLANTAEFGGVYARQFLVASNVTLTGRVTNNTTSGGGFWTADSVGFISISSPNDYILMSHPQGGIVSTLDEWTFGLSGVNIATWSTNNSTIRSNFLVGALLSARNIKLTGGQTASSLLRLDSSTNLATVTIGANLSFDGTTLSATGGGGGGGTNFPNVNLLLGSTNLPLSAGVRKAFHNQTNGSHGINLNLAVPESGYVVTYSVSNSSSSDITVTFYTNSVAANPYDIASKTNVNTFTASASAITEATLKYIGSGIWVIENVIGPATILEFGSGITAVTNGVNGRTISISASGGSGSSSFNITNVTVSDTNEIVLDVSAFDIAKITLLTNLNLLTFSNVSTMGKRSQVYFQQDTNGTRLISQNRVAGGLLQTNANLQPTTNANALDLLEIMPGFFTSNAIAWWPQNFQPRVAFTNSLAGSGAECATTDTALAHDVLLEGWQGDGTENAWTEAGTPGMITMGADSSALTSGKPDGACDLAMSFDNVGFGTENWVRWDNGSAIDVDTIAIDVVFYIYVETRLDSGESFNIVSANPTTTFSSTLGASIALGDNGTAATLTARGNTVATAGTLTSGQWNLVKLHIDTATTGNASYLQINGGSTLGFNRSTGGEDVQYFNFGAGSSLDAGDVCKFWIDVVAINTP